MLAGGARISEDQPALNLNFQPGESHISGPSKIICLWNAKTSKCRLLQMNTLRGIETLPFLEQGESPRWAAVSCPFPQSKLRIVLQTLPQAPRKLSDFFAA